MLHLTNALVVLLVWVNLAGLALACRKLAPSWILVRVASPVVLVATLFFVEHFVGLGRLGWLMPISTVASAWFVGRNARFLREHWRTELVFTCGFLYALAWRYAFPDLGPSSEEITDLTFVANYLGGGKLPPVDRWLPPFPFDMYYAMQHYGAALLGRIFDFGPGMAYNLGFCIVVALVITAIAGTAMILVRRRQAIILLTAAVVVGGVGTAPFIRLVAPNPPLHASVRFIGSFLQPEFATYPFGRWLIRASHVTPETQDLPVETFSYLVGLGDYHPPLSGFLLLMLALLCVVHIEAGIATRASFAVLGASVAWMTGCNTWQFPLQAALAGGYVLFRLYSQKPVEWKPLAAGFLAALFLLSPFLAHFATASPASGMHIRLVPAGTHTPPLLWLLTFYPLLALIGLHLTSGEKSRWTIGFCLLWIAFLIGSEMFYADDLYAGKFERFNTALKWWAWIYSGGVLLIGGLNLRSASRVCRVATAVLLILSCAFAGELLGHWQTVPKPHLGQLDGSAAVREDAGERVILEVLRRAPPAIVLQRIPTGAYTIQPMLTILAGQTAFLGWPNHENVWRSNRADIEERHRDVDAFYRGDMLDGSGWLESNHISYVLWLRDDNPLRTFDKIDAQLKDHFVWRPYYEAGEYRVGMWQLRSDTQP
jgi:uncharacterized membrane protein